MKQLLAPVWIQPEIDKKTCQKKNAFLRVRFVDMCSRSFRVSWYSRQIWSWKQKEITDWNLPGSVFQCIFRWIPWMIPKDGKWMRGRCLLIFHICKAAKWSLCCNFSIVFPCFCLCTGWCMLIMLYIQIKLRISVNGALYTFNIRLWSILPRLVSTYELCWSKIVELPFPRVQFMLLSDFPEAALKQWLFGSNLCVLGEANLQRVSIAGGHRYEAGRPNLWLNVFEVPEKCLNSLEKWVFCKDAATHIDLGVVCNPWFVIFVQITRRCWLYRYHCFLFAPVLLLKAEV